MDRSNRRTRSSARDTNQTRAGDTIEKPKTPKTKGARLLGKLTKSGKASDTIGTLVDYNDSADEESCQTSAKKTLVGVMGARVIEKLNKYGNASGTGSAVVYHDDNGNCQESMKRNVGAENQMLQELGDDPDVSDDDKISVEAPINRDGEGDNNKTTLPKKKSSDNAVNLIGLEPDPAKATSSVPVSDASNDQKTSKRVREDHLETSTESYEKRVCLETDFDKDELEPIDSGKEKNNSVEEKNSKNLIVKHVLNEDIGALQTDADTLITKNTAYDVQESCSNNESIVIPKFYSMVESQNIKILSLDANIQEMNSIVKFEKIKLQSDDADIQENNSMVESQTIDMQCDDADDQGMHSMLGSNSILKQNDDADVLEVESMLESKESLMQSNNPETLEKKMEYDVCQELLTNADNALHESDTLAGEIANDDSGYLQESDGEQDKAGIGINHGWKTIKFADELLDMNFGCSLSDNDGLILRRSDGVSLTPDFLELFKNEIHCPQFIKINDDWRVNLPLEYARVLQVCVNGFRLLDCTLEASLDTDDENIVGTDGLNEWLLCIISRRMNNLRSRDSKRVKTLIMSALYNHAIDPMTFKCLPCTNDSCSQTTCGKYHNAGEKRNKNIVAYPQCPRRCLEPGCNRAAACKGTHSTNDVLFHHTNFLSKVCHNISPTGECKFSTPCSFAHPGTPDMFYRPEWEDLYVVGLEKSFLFLAGAIRNLKKLNPKARRQDQYHVVFIASHNGVADAAHSFIKELAGTHTQVVINRTGKFQINAARGAILISTLPRLFELAINYSINFSESYCLIFDDVSALLSDSQAPMLRKFLSILPTSDRNLERMNKVVVCSKVKQLEVLQMEQLLSTKFTVKTSIPNVEKYFLPISAARASVDPTKASATAAVAKPQRAKASSRWDVTTAATKQNEAKASPRWDGLAGTPPASTRKPSPPSAPNFVVKSPPVVGTSLVEFLAQVRADRSSPHAPWFSSSDAAPKDAGPPSERFGYNRTQNRPDEWSRNSDDVDAGAGQNYNRNQKGSNGWTGNSGDGYIGARQRQNNFGRKRNRGDDWSGNFGDRDSGARPRYDDNDRKRNRGNDWRGNSGNRNAGPHQKNFDYNRKQGKDNAWVENSNVMNFRKMSSRGKVNRGRPYTMQGQNTHPVSYSSAQNIQQLNSMLVPSKSYGQSGETNDSWASRSYSSPGNNIPGQTEIPIQNFHTPAGIQPDHNQFMGQDPHNFSLQGSQQMYSPSIERPANKFQGSRRSQTDCSLQGSRPDLQANRSFHATCNTVQAAASSGAPKFSNMDEKLEAVLAPAFAVESVGPAVEAIVTAARQLGANSREALALFADKDHATIFSVYFNTLEEKATNLAGTDQFLIYQRAVAFGRAILNMAKRDIIK